MKTPQKSATGTELPKTKLNPYLPSTEKQMISFYKMLSEKDKRLYAAAEAIKLPYGGITYISKLFGCDRKTIRRGILELTNPELIETDRNRKSPRLCPAEAKERHGLEGAECRSVPGDAGLLR